MECNDSWKSIPFRLAFDDGSVILVAERTAFRVHACLLARHSPVLKKLFAIPRTSEAEHHNGCPVFQLSDTAEDLDYFLQLIYNGPSYVVLPSVCLSSEIISNAAPDSLLPPFNLFYQVTKPTFAMLSAYIRLGYKYEIFTLVDDAIRFLEAYFTTNFDVWERLRKGEREVPFTPSENPAADAIDTVNIARMTGTPSLLPLALYQCCQLDPVNLIEGVKRSEADTEVFSLSNADVALCFRAKERLLKVSANVSAISLLLNRCGRPEISETCTGRVYGISTSGVLRLDQDLTTDPLGYDPSMDEEAEPQYVAIGDVELCRICRREMASRVRSAKQRIWSELPSYFDLLGLDPFIRMVITDPLVREAQDEGN